MPRELTSRETEALVAYARLGTQELAAQKLGVHKQTIKNRIQSAKAAKESVSTVQLLWLILDGDTKFPRT